MKKDHFDAEEEVNSCMFTKGKKNLNPDEQMAVFMHRFNLDWDTVECMPAFKEHRKALFPQAPKKEKS